MTSEEKIHLEKEHEIKEFICELTRLFHCKLAFKSKPEIFITSNSGKTIGTIKEPQSKLTTKEFEIYNSKDILIYKVVADYFQLGICWRNSLYGQCKETTFPIYTVINNQINENKDGLITKKFSACANENNLEYPDSLEIIFPDGISFIDKFLITLCGMVIDYRFYEIDPSG